MRKFLSLDLQEMRSELLTKDFVHSSEALGPTEAVFRTKVHGYRRVEDSVFLHILNFEVGQPYRLQMARRGLVCIQITIKGTYNRWIGDTTDLVSSALIQITNTPRSVVDAEAGTKFRGIMIACERQYLLDTYGVNVDSIPPAYRPIFTSDVGMLEALRLPTTSSTISIADQLIACKFPEPLRSLYVKAKSTELICDVVSQINMLPTQGAVRIGASPHKSQAIETAASIYRREIYRPPTIEQLTTRVGLNRNDLTNGFREMFGVTPHHYGLAARMEQAQILLCDGRLSISEIARRVGYEGYSSFAKAYRAHFGRGPHLAKNQSKE
ncbi:helix-turn-helix domain-containing protein [Sinorhizobium meliloti]|uniref:helix-turn-helix domain-containing protein n=1 Tax=Rhizobium meliloti TaxID=382 RepID=UPI000FD7D243|nr:AraC family transcriptional regulator [Sinorhizobium meliloti]RVG73120.1 AraC family transcriptional regulator [Sinorhizobium meliloti]